MPPIIIAGVIAAGAAGGASIYAAKKGANASKNAAAIQSASADKALALQRQMYEQQQQNLAPYRSLGEGSLQNLGNFQSYAGTPGAFGAGMQSQYQHALSPGFQMPPQGAGPVPGAPDTAPWSGRGGPFKPFNQGTPGTLANPGGTPPDQIEMVTMESPDGETMAVPANEVPHYLGEGARVVNEGAAYGR